jgi:hypothetical protein
MLFLWEKMVLSFHSSFDSMITTLGLTAPDQLDHTSLEGMDRASEHDFEF